MTRHLAWRKEWRAPRGSALLLNNAGSEACEAYIKSQRGMGWTALAVAYDDGGLSHPPCTNHSAP